MPSFGELNELDSIFFCSDHTRKQKVFKLAIVDLIEALKIVGSDYPSSASYDFDEKLGDYKVVNLSKNDPDFEAKVRTFFGQEIREHQE
ncbi:hypothetical protein [Microcoleus sp. herbarium2]|uniref:hypothetical protein n=1 Tax=Microcoleus sp. herbarium2 TaxID=3055433 RepID=UPI002FD08A87